MTSGDAMSVRPLTQSPRARLRRDCTEKEHAAVAGEIKPKGSCTDGHAKTVCPGRATDGMK
jgi:hypothetical protein